MSAKVSRYVSFFVLGCFLAVVSLLVLAQLVITPERIRTTLVPVAERYLDCNINLEAVDVSLFSGVTLSNLELLNNVDGVMILAADKVVLRYQLLPLFTQRIVIDEIRLEHPRVNVERYADGSINFYDFITQKKLAGEQALLLNDDLPADINILISHLYVQRGELLFKDYSFSSVPHRYKLTDFDLHLTNFSLQRDFDFELWGKFNGAPIDAEGTVNLKQRHYDFELIIEQLEMVQFQPYYRSEINGRIDGLIMSMNARFSGGQDTLDSSGVVQLHQLDYSSASSTDITIQASLVDAQYRVLSDLHQQVTIEKLHLDCDGVRAEVAGNLVLSGPDPDIDLHFFMPKWSLRDGYALLPRSSVAIFSGYDLAGDVELDLILRGQGFALNQLIEKSTITFDAVQASIGSLRPSLSGVVTTFGDALVAKDLAVVLGDNSIALDLTCENIWARRPTIQADIGGKTFDYKTTSTRIRSNFGRSGDGSGGGLTLRELTEPDAVRLPFDVVGTLSVDTVRLQQIDCLVLKSQFSLRNNILHYDSLTCAAAGGTVNSSGHVDLTRQGYSYAGHVAGHGLQLAKLSHVFASHSQGKVSGVLAVAADYSGAGTQKLRVQQNLSAVGSFEVENGVMSGTAFMEDLSEFFGVDEFKVFRFSKGEGRFTLHTGGQLHYDAQFLSSQSQVNPVGTWRYGDTLAAQIAVYLSPALVAQMDQRSKIIPHLQQRDGWSRVPLSVTGSLASPRFDIDEFEERVDHSGGPDIEDIDVGLMESMGKD